MDDRRSDDGKFSDLYSFNMVNLLKKLRKYWSDTTMKVTFNDGILGLMIQMTKEAGSKYGALIEIDPNRHFPDIEYINAVDLENFIIQKTIEDGDCDTFDFRIDLQHYNFPTI